MNLNELMLGDWILFGDKPVQVTGDLFLPGHFTSSYKPIPLTKEILKANDFERAYTDEERLKPCMGETFKAFYKVPGIKNSGFFLEDWTECYCLTDHMFIRIQYVHELQHLLRMIGIEKEVMV